MKTCGGTEVQLQAFLTSALYGGDWQFHAPAALSPREGPLVPTGEQAGQYEYLNYLQRVRAALYRRSYHNFTLHHCELFYTERNLSPHYINEYFKYI
jgi:hypothetical protein